MKSVAKMDMSTMSDREVRQEILTALQGQHLGDGVTVHTTSRMDGYQAMGKAMTTRAKRVSMALTPGTTGVPSYGAGGPVEAPDYLMG